MAESESTHEVAERTQAVGQAGSAPVQDDKVREVGRPETVPTTQVMGDEGQRQLKPEGR